MTIVISQQAANAALVLAAASLFAAHYFAWFTGSSERLAEVRHRSDCGTSGGGIHRS